MASSSRRTPRFFREVPESTGCTDPERTTVRSAAVTRVASIVPDSRNSSRSVRRSWNRRTKTCWKPRAARSAPIKPRASSWPT